MFNFVQGMPAVFILIERCSIAAYASMWSFLIERAPGIAAHLHTTVCNGDDFLISPLRDLLPNMKIRLSLQNFIQVCRSWTWTTGLSDFSQHSIFYTRLIFYTGFDEQVARIGTTSTWWEDKRGRKSAECVGVRLGITIAPSSTNWRSGPGDIGPFEAIRERARDGGNIHFALA